MRIIAFTGGLVGSSNPVQQSSPQSSPQSGPAIRDEQFSHTQLFDVCVGVKTGYITFDTLFVPN